MNSDYRVRHADGAGWVLYAAHHDGVVGVCAFQYGRVELDEVSTYGGSRHVITSVGLGLGTPDTAFPNVLRGIAWARTHGGPLVLKLGFHVGSAAGGTPRTHWVAVPWWFVNLVFVLLAFPLFYGPAIRWRRRRRGRCPSCGYLLHGMPATSEKCPECGSAMAGTSGTPLRS